MKIALQLYTVRDAIHNEQELFEVLGKVRELGYSGVEFAGYFGAEPTRLAARLEELGLAVLGSHEGIDAMEKDMDSLLDYAVKLVNKNIVMAWSPADTPSEVERTLRVLREARKKAEAQGISVLYHNHSHEFKQVEGKRPIDSIMEVCPLEADCYWVFFAGENPGEFLHDHSEQIGLVHLKDGGKTKASPCAIGEGVNDIAGIAKAAEETDKKWLIVENDNPVPTGLEDAARSISWLQKEGWA